MPTELHNQLEIIVGQISDPDKMTRDQLTACLQKAERVLPELMF